MTEAASHAERAYRVSHSLAEEARSLFGKQPDAIQAHLVIDAGEQITARDEGVTRELHVHHLRGWAEYPAGRLDPENAVTLCRGCHILQHSNGGDANE